MLGEQIIKDEKERGYPLFYLLTLISGSSPGTAGGVKTIIPEQ